MKIECIYTSTYIPIDCHRRCKSRSVYIYCSRIFGAKNILGICSTATNHVRALLREKKKLNPKKYEILLLTSTSVSILIIYTFFLIKVNLSKCVPHFLIVIF